MKFLLLTILLILPLFASCSELLKFLTLPQRDRVSRVCQLTAANVNDYIINHTNNGLILIIKESATLAQVVEQQLCRSDFAETVAQLLEKKNFTVCELSLNGGIVNNAIGNSGDVIIYYGGTKHLYFGKRDAAALLMFIHKLGSSRVSVITGKLDKVAYDAIPGPKLVGFFMGGTPDYVAFETAAVKYSPEIPFYVALDRTVAKHLKLINVGQINLVKPLEKLAVPCPVNPATEADIDAFIAANSGVVMKELNEHNMYDPQLINPNKTTFLAIGERVGAVGHYFRNILIKTIRNVSKEYEKQVKLIQQLNVNPSLLLSLPQPPAGSTSLTPGIANFPLINLNFAEIVWIDPQLFPTIYITMDQLQSQYGFPAGHSVYFGAVNINGNQSVWFNSALINTTADKQADEANVALLREWMLSVLNNSVKPNIQTASAGPQKFLTEPKGINVTPNSNFVLECVVESQVGDCLWLKDGRNIGFNLARLAPHYSWRGDRNSGDCSLVVAGADAARDDGKWQCEVTGDVNNPTITSAPAVVSVKSTVTINPSATAKESSKQSNAEL